jgi:uncharacterized protein YgfB (UPF0149 family)
MEILIDLAVPVLTFVLGLGILAKPLQKVKAIVAEVTDVLIEIDEALEDGKVSKAELEDVVKEIRDIVELF